MPPSGRTSPTSSSTLSAEPAVVLVSYGSDPLDSLAALVLERHRRELPDLSRHTVLLPHGATVTRFRRLLLAHVEDRGYGALLAPWCGPLDAWLQQSDTGLAPLDDTERELMLLEALARHGALKERFGTWALIDALLALFDELNAHRRLPAADCAELTALLAAGYAADPALEPLRREAELVYTLWNGWNAHLAARGFSDTGLHRLAALARRRDRPAEAGHIYMVGTVDLTPPEADWLRRLLTEKRATLILQGDTRAAEDHPDAALNRCFRLLDLPVPTKTGPEDAYTQFIDEIYLTHPDMTRRARALAAAHAESPAAGRLHVHPAADFEQEARAVELAVRRWRAAGLREIGIVTHDRKLARRARALLERANVRLHDAAGWALSTTSAATVIVRWLECIAQDFAHGPLLDFLKSPFTAFGSDRAALDPLVHAFERHVRAHNVSGGLDRYRRVLEARAPDEEARRRIEPLLRLLDRLRAAAGPFDRLRRGAHPLPRYLDALRRSLELAGLTEALGADAAGAQVLAVLRPHRRALTTRGARFAWPEFERWLQRELERARFHPPFAGDGIELLGLAESRCRTFDALVLAGCNREHLPGPLAGSPFFNDGVRTQLGLRTRRDRQLVPLHDFRRLLEAAPRILITWRRSERGEPLVPSPWTERLVAFHRLAYGRALDDVELAALLASPETELFRRDTPPPPVAVRPAPALPAARLPAILTASAHQQLLDCPYQFFAAAVLGLKPLETVREELEKPDYGRLVHRILQAFHAGLAGLPGPWRGTITAENRAAAEDLLRELGRQVFGYDKDRRFSTRGWQYRWERFVPAYLDWQQERERAWRTQTAERSFERAVAAGRYTLMLRGRLDRIDRGPDGLAILDYKTGAIPEPEEVAAGEYGQLPFYALLAPERVHEVAYAAFRPDAVEMKTRFAGEALAALVRSFEERLHALMHALSRGARLPAWGDAHTCRYCRFEGLCRKEMWDVDVGS